MSTVYPGAIDALTNPTTTDQTTSPSHAAQHANANDAIEAIETRVGTTGTSFPGSPATGNRFYRTDRDILYFYDGTRWLSEQIYEAVAGTGTFAGISVAASVPMMPQHSSAIDVWMIDFRWAYQVFTTHNASNYWQAKLVRVNGSTETIISTLTTNKATLTSWINPAATTVGAAVGTSDQILYTTFVKNGSPGLLNAMTAVRYRLIG